MKYTVVLLKSSIKDYDKIKQIPALKRNADKLISLLRENPYQNPLHYE